MTPPASSPLQRAPSASGARGQGLNLILAGAALGNGNRGVEALGRSVVDAVHQEAPGSRLTVLDDGWGVRRDSSGAHPDVTLELAGVRLSRRWHRPESWVQIRAAQMTLPRLNPVATRYRESDAVLDLSGGDSFTDLYGSIRLRLILAPKVAALRSGTPLVLLPQTYGPFVSNESRRVAGDIIRSATLAYARDAHSYAQMLEIAGPDADPARLRAGVDVAFALEPRTPRPEVVDQLQARTDAPVVGVNVSGLLRDRAAHQQFDIAGDYIATMTALTEALVDAGAHVVLVPHVHLPSGGGESDLRAIEVVRTNLDAARRARTSVVPTDLDAAELKWCIARMDWFVGSRMHSTIAALSTFTPASAYAYSDKTRGVFETCGVGDQVVDARACGGEEAVEQLMAGFHARASTQSLLQEHATGTVAQSREQLRDILQVVRAGTAPADATGRTR